MKTQGFRPSPRNPPFNNKIFPEHDRWGNHMDVTHNTKHRILINKTKFTPYCVPPAHAPASV